MFDVKTLTSLAGLKVKRYSPEILTAVGVISFVGTVIVACKQTTKASEILDRHKKEMDEIKEVIELDKKGELVNSKGEEIKYDSETIKNDKLAVWSRTAVDFGKLYFPVVALSAVSLGSFLAANKILKTRYLGAVATLNIVSEAFDRYRARVREDGGVDLDRKYMYGSSYDKNDIIEVDENGKKHKSKETVENINSLTPLSSPYAKFFDSTCPDFEDSPELNMLFLQAREAQANKIFERRGILFLNEVYDMIGVNRTEVGQYVGWKKGLGDDYISFGLNNIGSEATRRFVNGLESVILLDFNVDGYVADKI